MKYYIDDAGNYLGGSDSIPLSNNEVLTPPEDAREIWDGLKWEMPLEIARIDKHKESHNECEKALELITSQYSNSERETWTMQELEASNFLHDTGKGITPRATPNLDWIIAEKDGLPVDDVKRLAFATRVIGKAIDFHEYSSTMVGKRHKMTDAVEAATTIEELNGIIF